MPAAEKTKVIEPMSATAGTMCVPGRNANVMPTASASMLVAIASRSMALNASEPSSLSSSFDSASRIMLPPMMPSSTNVIQ